MSDEGRKKQKRKERRKGWLPQGMCCSDTSCVLVPGGKRLEALELEKLLISFKVDDRG